MSLLSILFTALNLSFALLIFFLTLAFATGAPFVRSNKKAVDAMIRLARLKPGMKVYDLGSGDGTLLFRAADLGAIAVGLEINPFLVLWTNIKILLSLDRNRVTVRWQNFWRTDIHDADVVFVYLLPWRMEKLATKLENELKPGSLVISNSFIFPNWKILRSDESSHIYVFKIIDNPSSSA
ncbi:MAG: hypothetical protein Q8L37_05700 [Candidatus Gottesmanbacteria bacterium]|nr:hypothetical protein [Candidatus Gottesmanbacteria bacterium]